MAEQGSAKATLSLPCVLVIVMAGVERFANKGVGSNLVTYLTGVVGMSTAAAAKSVITWNGVSFMLPLVSAILADSYWDRYSTIAFSSLLYVLGMIALSAWALLRTRMPRSTLFFPLYLTSIGQGGYQPALQAFGADQLAIGDDDDAESGLTAEQKGKVKSMFFQWWYFGMCSGSLLGNSTMSYVQDNFGWGLGFTIPSAVMALSVAAFFCCTPLYKQTPQPKGARRPSPCNIFKFQKSIIAGQKISLQSIDEDDDGNGDAISELELQEKPLKAEPADPKESLDEAAPSVAKIIQGLLPIWAILLVFAVIFQQPTTFFTKQGMLMNHTVAGGSFVIPPAMLQSSITVSIILLVPMYDKMIIPLINAITGSSDGITVLQRIGIGMVLSVVAMVTAALVESWRLRVATTTTGGGEGAARLSIFWLLPQYVLLGVSDVFTVVGMQEFFYTQVPTSMRTIGIGLYLSVFGVGGFLGAFLITALEIATARPGNARGWFSDDPREAHLDNFYWFLALLCFISFVIFTHMCKYYRGKDASGK
ncbi:Protein NRT1/ PTR FAMILY 5.8 [Dichanthelium oligosanthes]|uniref:Protein NRT1/ PTR FAMILY 5.8 n=1 Tax=Dichanthelium oligosanthes TaxID=888268 RepID=A0A1E5UKV8_9POAL|nr:Protein NRT1/ PTR FAMILY 5.8 [Dichanthelium oligosanthes]